MASGSGALSGAAAGAQMGTSIMPGWGTAIGAAAGAIGGAFGLGGGSGPSGPSYYDLLNQRQQEMQQFSSQLSLARNNYINQMNNLNKTVMSQFAPDLESSYGARGLNVTGGAFQSALARQSAMLGAQANVGAAQMQDADTKALMSWAGNPMSMGNPYGMAGYTSGLQAQQYNTMGQGNLMGAGLSSFMQPNRNSVSPMQGFSSLFGRSPVAPSSQPGYQSFNEYNNQVTGQNNF